jgi:hypothetical protein
VTSCRESSTLFDSLLQPFLDKKPVAVLARATLEHAFAADALDELFRTTATQQYRHAILFSRLVELLTAVVTRRSPSVHAAYRADPARLGASVSSVYDKLNHTEPAIADALLRHTTAKLRAVMTCWPTHPQPVPGLTLKVIDGNYFAGTDHRREVLRGHSAAALPGMAVVVQDHGTGLITHVLGEPDAYVNERALADRLLDTVGANELVVADRNFCFAKLLTGIADRRSFFLVRLHRRTRYQELGSRHRVGETDTGEVFEQRVRVAGRRLRLVVVVLNEPTRDGETEIRLLTNLSSRQARGGGVARTYRLRWRLEATFLEVTTSVQCELNTLGYPQAALLTFALALCACNALRVVQRALEVAQAEQPTAVPISTDYLANEMNECWGGLDVVTERTNWSWAATASAESFAAWLLRQAEQVDVRRYAKTTRGPRKPVEYVKLGRLKPHRSTARLLKAKKALPNKPRRP